MILYIIKYRKLWDVRQLESMLEFGERKLITILHDDDLLCANFPRELERFLKEHGCHDDIPLIGFDTIY